jgi:hypothetical protein
VNKLELLLTLLKESVEKCYQQDFTLIKRSMEQASVARVYYYMQEKIYNDERFLVFRDEYHLDNEYNKNGTHIKSTPRCKYGTRPDIILHKRSEEEYTTQLNPNLLVVEFKSKNGRSRKYGNTDKSIDFVKLEDFTKESTYNYFIGVFVKLKTNGAEYKYFQQGTEKRKEDLYNE